MEPNFQTSFIPKKPMTEERVVSSRPVGFLMIISIFIFFTVVLASGGLYFYRAWMQRNIAQMENDLNLAKSRFEPSKIVQLQVLDKRLNASKEILSKHVAISPIFEVLQNITMKTVQYTSFAYELGDGNESRISVTMNGVAVGYRSIALQSDLFANNEFLIDPVFSDLSLDDKGNVVFKLEFSVDPNLVNYKQMLQTREGTADPFEPFIEDSTNDQLVN